MKSFYGIGDLNGVNCLLPLRSLSILHSTERYFANLSARRLVMTMPKVSLIHPRRVPASNSFLLVPISFLHREPEPRLKNSVFLYSIQGFFGRKDCLRIPLH